MRENFLEGYPGIKKCAYAAALLIARFDPEFAIPKMRTDAWLNLAAPISKDSGNPNGELAWEVARGPIEVLEILIKLSDALRLSEKGDLSTLGLDQAATIELATFVFENRAYLLNERWVKWCAFYEKTIQTFGGDIETRVDRKIVRRHLGPLIARRGRHIHERHQLYLFEQVRKANVFDQLHSEHFGRQKKPPLPEKVLSKYFVASEMQAPFSDLLGAINKLFEFEAANLLVLGSRFEVSE